MNGPSEINNALILILVVIGVIFEMTYIRKHPRTIRSSLKIAAIAALLIEGTLQVMHFVGLVPPKIPNDWFEWGVFALVAVIVAKAISESGDPHDR